MKRTFLKRVVTLLLLTFFTFSFIGCEKDYDKNLPRITHEESGYMLSHKEHEDYDNFEQISNFVINEPKLKNQYYYVINTEGVPRSERLDIEPISYHFCSNGVVDNEYVDPSILVVDRFIKDENAPQKKLTKKDKEVYGRSDVTCMYEYYAYPTEEINTPLTFKQYIIENNINIFYRVIQVYQGDKIVGSFFYYVEKSSPSYYEKFLKDHLMIIGVNA